MQLLFWFKTPLSRAGEGFLHSFLSSGCNFFNHYGNRIYCLKALKLMILCIAILRAIIVIALAITRAVPNDYFYND